MANSMDGQNSILSVVGPLATNVASLRLVTQALLQQEPWLYDPLVNEIPWRADHETQIKQAKKLCFGVLRTDGVVNPTPPVARAIDILVKEIKAAGHEVIYWTPPSHRTICDAGFNSWVYDGGSDVRSAFALSGEPMSPQVAFYQDLEKEFTGSEIAATNVKIRKLKKEYMDYWNSTSEKSGTGRPVDAVISPLAPWPAARREMYTYYGYSTFVNVLDYTSVVVPVTNVDKAVDKKVEGYQPIDKRDKGVQDSCKYKQHDAKSGADNVTDDPDIYHGAHVSLQIVGRSLQEEKMLAVAEYVAGLIGK
jgi:amidase